MFVLHILDEAWTCDTLEEAIKAIRNQLKEGTGLKHLELFKKIDFDVTFDVQVKDE